MIDESDRAEFSVVMFSPGDWYEYDCRFVSAAEAMRAFDRITKSVGARMGFVVRVIVTDGGDCTNVEWKFGQGLTYPTPDMLKEH